VHVNTAIVILNWNGRKLLETFLPGVVACSKNDSVIYVADNCSSDDSLEFVKKNFPEVCLILNDKNYGFAGGYNECLQKINADYFILLNSDVEVTPGWIPPVIKLMEDNPMIGACQPKIRSWQQKNFFEYAGACGGFIDHYGYPFCRGRIFNTLEEDAGQYDDSMEVFWASGACMFVRASVFKKLNGFDETFFAHMEEIDLCWRMQRNGYSILIQPESVVFHVGGGTLDKMSPRKTFLNFRNNILMLHKNLPASRLYFVIGFRLILDGIAGIKFLINDSPADCMAVIRAHFYFYKNIFIRIKIRKASKPAGIEFPVKGIYKRSLVFDYYLKGIRSFVQLKKKYFT
jgi:GT2 family glycosyltransferase